MRINVSSMFELIQDQTASGNLYLQQSLNEYGDAVLEEDEIHETNNPIMDKTLLDTGAEGFRVLTNFTPEKFEDIWGNAESAMTSRWNDGRGRKSATSAKDARTNAGETHRECGRRVLEAPVRLFRVSAPHDDAALEGQSVHSLALRIACDGRQVPAGSSSLRPLQ
ncbi:hypothetical protein H257_05190 [Aphanomyces astaci]|uniref:Uncharacterized protein n=1 Tax=Aphanomyces astaci TaxID=112090 RepID=W4GUP2_APHAT|nr:hypothetical protein H257_05190 [Aphanomyces astaci]ETV82613.1 hypothetical protein H257_05190 [Aphanomyces astaci]|eukprot:XP_009828282.1 hypothetical protein H257_05190 [Aphanomyces astaci]